MRLIASFVLLALVPLLASAARDTPLKVLYITGGGYHDYPAQSKIITEGLRQRLNVEITVKNVEGGREAAPEHPAYNGEHWAEGFDLVIHNMCNSAQINDPAAVEHIAKPHRSGTPGIFIHCAMHCFRATENDAWGQLVGVTTKNHEAHAPVTVTREAHDHPIMQGFPETWELPKGELYRVTRVWPGTTVLATAVSGEGNSHPVIWSQTYGKGRIFGTTLGHYNEEVAAPQFLDTLGRGVIWVTGKN